MKKNILFKLILSVIVGSIILLNSCEYKEIADADYFDEVIYMPAALHNIYTINDIPRPRGETPTPGYPVRYIVDTDNNKFDILLGVYRSGVYSKGTFIVDIAVKTDTIVKLIDNGGLPGGTELLPSDKYSIVEQVTVKDGEDLSKFELKVDLDFLRNNYPDKKYAIAVEVSSTKRKTNPDFATTIILIDTKIMRPTANFTFTASPSNPNEISFTNTSLFGKEYSWNFGDGSANSSSESPVHLFSSSGDYTISLSVNGITGSMDADVHTEVISVP